MQQLKDYDTLINQLLYQNQELHHHNEILHRIQRPGYHFIARVLLQTGDLILKQNTLYSKRSPVAANIFFTIGSLLKSLSASPERYTLTVEELLLYKDIITDLHSENSLNIQVLDAFKGFNAVDLIRITCTMQEQKDCSDWQTAIQNYSKVNINLN